MEKRKRSKRRPNASFQCFACRETFRRADGKIRRGTFYCAACHEKSFPIRGPSPTCPECGGDFEFFKWGGSVETTTVHCTESCGFAARALDFFDELAIKVQAAPIG